MPLIRHRRRPFLLYKKTGMQKWAGMLDLYLSFIKCFPVIFYALQGSGQVPRHLWTLLRWWHTWRGLRLLEFATFDDLVLANTSGHHKASRRWIWHSPNGQHHNQIDYILVRKRFQSEANMARTRRFPGADIGTDHDLLMMTFRLHLKKKLASQNTQDSSLTSKSWKIPTCWKPSKLR